LIKDASKSAENAKVRIRGVRQEGIKELKLDLKNGLPVDEEKSLEKKASMPFHIHFTTCPIY